MSLQTKKAVVTGGSTGMGLAIAEALVAAGGEVLITGQSQERLLTAQRTLGPRAHILLSNTADRSAIAQLGGVVQERFGTIDAVFVNAGYCRLTPFSEVTEQEYDHTFDVNTKGAYFTTQRLAPLVREGGAFVFITSIANATGYAGMSVYAGSKAALRAFGQNVAAELAPRNIRVNTLSPGFIATPTMGLVEASPEDLEAFVQEGVRASPLGRIGTPAEVARAALFLAFEATFTNAHELTIDGGMLNITATSAHEAER
jgi:NAD(P)-dependent dehydrogenase (short-subunit alcohol dehydrogenase family)